MKKKKAMKPTAEVKQYLIELGRRGGTSTAKRRTKEERSAAARKAVTIRWYKTKEKDHAR